MLDAGTPNNKPAFNPDATPTRIVARRVRTVWSEPSVMPRRACNTPGSQRRMAMTATAPPPRTYMPRSKLNPKYPPSNAARRNMRETLSWT